MTQAGTIEEVFQAIQRVKAVAPDFRTNFYPAQKKLAAWIQRGDLTIKECDGAAIFLRRDRDLEHLYFCAADIAALRRELPEISSLRSGRVVTDVIGDETALKEILESLELAGFRRYSRLQRMARAAGSTPDKVSPADAPVFFADAADEGPVLELLENSFNRCADQLPAPYEIAEAIGSKQIFAIKSDGELAAMLHFETQGMTSSIRYWVVAAGFQSRRLGASLIRHYFASQAGVRRFLLWVNAGNENAVAKYCHYGYSADGLIDHVLASARIAA